VFFIQKDRKVRRLKVAGIYNTGLSEDFDNIYLLCDLHLIQKINSWTDSEVGGFEISLKDDAKNELATRQISEKIGFDFNLKSTKEIYPQIFNWLELQNLNVFVIITLITLVAGITMISTLLILVLENSKQIGLLKALGASDKLIGKTYQMVGSRLLLRGMILGNLVAIIFAILQIKFGIISLDEESYYINKVPINFTWTGIIIINLSTYLICMLMLIIPSKVISNISPIKVLRFE
jgi:lipoprotein-releasing system permease protein